MIDYVIIIFKNYDLLDVQRKIFSSLFVSGEYRLIIVDNTPLSQKKEIIPLENELILLRDSNNEFDGISHGAALDYGLTHVTSDIVCIFDSDFFILNKNINKYIIEKFNEGYEAVGAEYSDGKDTLFITNKFPELFENIPCCFCAFYKVELAKSNSWIVTPSEVDFNTSFIEVGWRIRKHIIDNKIKTLHWKTATRSDNCLFTDNDIIMGIHNVAGSHRNGNITYNGIIENLRNYNDFEL